MKPGAVLPLLVLALPAVAQDLPEISAEDAGADAAAVEAAGLSDSAYRNLWCAGSFALRHAADVVDQPAAAGQSAASRDALYGKAAIELLAAGLAEADFTALAETVYRVVLSQTRAEDATARDFTAEQCDAAALP